MNNTLFDNLPSFKITPFVYLIVILYYSHEKKILKHTSMHYTHIANASTVHKHFKASTFFAISKQLCRIISASSMCTLHFVVLNLLLINNIFQSINRKFVHIPLQRRYRRSFICCTLIFFVVRCRNTRDVTFISCTPACCYI